VYRRGAVRCGSVAVEVDVEVEGAAVLVLVLGLAPSTAAASAFSFSFSSSDNIVFATLVMSFINEISPIWFNGVLVGVWSGA
jgi:hypothetical protein